MKELDQGSIPGFGRSPGEANGYPLQYSRLENSMDRGAWRATVHGSQRIRHPWSNLARRHGLYSSQSILPPKTYHRGETETAQHFNTFLKVNFPLCSEEVSSLEIAQRGVERQEGEPHCLDGCSAWRYQELGLCLGARCWSPLVIRSPFPDLKTRFVIVPASKECWEMSEWSSVARRTCLAPRTCYMSVWWWYWPRVALDGEKASCEYHSCWWRKFPVPLAIVGEAWWRSNNCS